ARLARRTAVYMVVRGVLHLAARRLGGKAKGPADGITAASVSSVDWGLFEALLKEMKRVCARDGAVLIVARHPTPGEVGPLAAPDPVRRLLEAQIQAHAARLGLDFCD